MFKSGRINCREKINWHSGTGEVIEFAAFAPLVVYMVCAIISIATMTLTDQKLAYTAYCAGRAAAVTQDSGLALKRATVITNLMMPGMTTSMNIGSDAEGEGCSLNVSGAWQKGNMLKVTARKSIDVFLPFISGDRSATVTMMIENGSRFSIDN